MNRYAWALALLLLAPPAEAYEPIRVELRVRGDESVFLPSDDVVLYAEADRDCYLVVYNVDPYGRVRLLFPEDPRESAWVDGGRRVRIPSAGSREGLSLGDPGVEFIAGVASDEPIDVERWFPDREFSGLREIYWDEALDDEGFSEDYWVEEDPSRAMELINARIVPEKRRTDGYGDERLALRVRRLEPGTGDPGGGGDYRDYPEVEVHHYVHYGSTGWDPWWRGPYDPFWVRSGWGWNDPWYDPWYDDFSWRVSVHVGSFYGWRHHYPTWCDGYWYPGVVVAHHPVWVVDRPAYHWGSQVKWKTYERAVSPGGGSSPATGSPVKWKGAQLASAPAKHKLAAAAVTATAGAVKAPRTQKPVSAVAKPAAPSRPAPAKSATVAPKTRAERPRAEVAPPKATPPAKVKEAPPAKVKEAPPAKAKPGREPREPKRVEKGDKGEKSEKGEKKSEGGKGKGKGK